MDLTPHTVNCPHCWEPIELGIDPSVADQRYVEDCPVCCRPMEIQVLVEEGEARVEAWPGNG